MEAREFSHIDAESNEETSEMLFTKRRCGYCIPCFGSSNGSSPNLNWWRRIRTPERDDGSFWVRGIGVFKKLREWSEIVAGPRWKTFIRRFNRNKSGVISRNAKFQYDPLSYALNFDEGPGQNGNPEEEIDYISRNFSSRYASVPVSAKTSMDLGKDDPTFV
ncbi:unnamed protein product [Ilex paraguariensis]|uniref:Uncharacterized protein n=1 Tax=Ilex paraguariensis TaxID=185542 RepID=A0ABC8R0U8_9AQUA